MKFSIKIVYIDQIEPTFILEANDKSEIKQNFNNLIDKILDSDSNIIGIYIGKEKNN